MSQKKALTLSIVIPVYNEEHHIRACLEAIKAQTDAPDEVLVVDNNSTDDTIAIAREYDFVRVISEKRQGRGWARSAGFDAAHSDVIGRIDADSRLASNWVAYMRQRFADDPELDGLTGLGETALIPRLPRPRSVFWSRAYYWVVHSSFHTITMWGACMGLRRSAWQQVRTLVCNDDRQVHEDQDVSLCLAAKGAKILQDNTLRIATGGQSYQYFPKMMQYAQLESRTLARHRQLGTFSAPRLRRLSWLSTLPGRVLAFTVGVPFILSSILLLPLDLLMLALGRGKTWLD